MKQNKQATPKETKQPLYGMKPTMPGTPLQYGRPLIAGNNYGVQKHTMALYALMMLTTAYAMLDSLGYGQPLRGQSGLEANTTKAATEYSAKPSKMPDFYKA